MIFQTVTSYDCYLDLERGDLDRDLLRRGERDLDRLAERDRERLAERDRERLLDLDLERERRRERERDRELQMEEKTQKNLTVSNTTRCKATNVDNRLIQNTLKVINSGFKEINVYNNIKCFKSTYPWCL